MLAISERVRPWRPRLNPSSSGRSTRAVPSSTTIRMLACMTCIRDPRGPVTVTTLPWPTVTSTPPGSSMGCFPIRLIVSLVPRPSPHVRHHFAADAVARAVPVRHHVLRRGNDRDPQSTHHPRQDAASPLHPPSGFLHAPEACARPLLSRPVL